jgi:hypothetical protein
MPLKAFRLHTGACKEKYKRSDRSQTDCECMIHVEGQLGDRFIRESTHSRTWSRVKKRVDKANKDGIWFNNKEADQHKETSSETTIMDACDTYIAGLRSKSVKNLQSPTVSKHRTVIKRLEAYAERLDLTHISQVDETVLVGFQQTWWEEHKIGPESSKGISSSSGSSGSSR